jgi:hypothetical protein
MKKILNKLVVAIVFVVFALSCQKADLALNNPLVSYTNLGTGSYIVFNSAVNYNLNFAAIAASKVGVKVDAYANNIGKIKEIKLFVVKGASADPKVWKAVKTIPFSGTTEVSATGAEIATALGTPIGTLFAPGQFYTFYNQIVTEDGKTFDLSNSVGALETSSNYNTCFRWTAFVVCPFTGGMAGKYKVVQDDWADWNVGDIVDVTDGPGANQVNISKVWPNVAYGSVKTPLVINVDPLTGTAKLPKENEAFADYGSLATTYTPGSGTVGYIFSCTGYIGLKMGLKYGGSDQGILTLTLQKQ